MDNITITTSPSGLHRANRTYKNIAISCPNDSATVVSDLARNTIRLIVEAVDKEWFRDDATQIGVIGSAHSTTKNDKGETIRDDKHITVTVKPGGKAKHLYLLPNEDNTTVSAATHLDTARQPSKP